MRIRLPNGFTPRPGYQRQYMAHFDNGGKEAFVVWHRRSGKDLTALHQECKMMHERRGVYWHVFPTMEQGRKAIWEGFTKDGQRTMEQVFPKAIRKSPKEFLPSSEMIVELKCGSIWRLIGSDRMEVVGAGPCHVSFSEYALAKPGGWNLIRPMLRENNGTVSFLTTPRGRNHAWKQWQIALADPRWFTSLKTILDTGAFPDPQAVMDDERKQGMPEPLIRQEYLCDWNAALVGSVWGDLIERLEKEGAVDVEFEHERDAVHVFFDLGIDDATALWFVRFTDGVEFIDYYEASGKPLSHFFDEMEKRPYRYTKFWLPHDARARTLQTGVSILDQFMARYPGQTFVGPGLSLMDGIQAGRWLLERKGTRFHPRCGDGMEALRQYHYEYDEEKKTSKSTPMHDWSSHGADAFRYTAIVAKVAGILKPEVPKLPPKVYTQAADKAFSLDKLWEDERPLRSRI